MKLERQVCLFYQKGTSDKVYEVDLCCVGDGEFVVNFRYGARGANLKHGSKTPLPVGRDEAERVFDKLVASKVKKGYAPQGTSAAPPPAATDESGEAGEDGRELADRRLLAELQLAAGKNPPRGIRRFSRLLWRVGERRLDGAQEVIRPILLHGEDRLVHTCAWTIARCGYAEFAPTLEQIAGQKKRPLWLKPWLAEARRHLQSADQQAEATRRFVAELSDAERAGLQSEDVCDWFRKTYQGPHYEKSDLLSRLYHFNAPELRPALMALIAGIPLRPPYWPHLRFIFKASILRDDLAVFTILAARITKTKARHGGYDTYLDSKWIRIHEEVRKPTSRVGFTHPTRIHLMSRVWREMRRAARDQPDRFIDTATRYLLQFRDEDNRKPKSREIYDWQTRQTLWLHYTNVSDFFPLAKLLFGQSERFWFMGESGRLRYREAVPPATGDDTGADVDPIEFWERYRRGEHDARLTGAPARREESYPALWDRRPDALVRLLAESRHHEVHRFAAKILREHPDRDTVVDDDALVAWLSAPYIETQMLTLLLIERRLQPDPFPRAMLTSLLRADFAPASVLALDFIKQHPHAVRAVAPLLVLMGLHQRGEVRRACADLLLGWVPSLEAQAQLGEVVTAALKGLTDTADHALLDDFHAAFAPVLADYWRRLDMAVLLEFLASPNPAVQRFAGRLLRDHETPAAELPPVVFQTLIEAEDAQVRAAGITLLAGLPIETLLEMDGLVLASVLSVHAPVRQASAALVERIAGAHRGFAVTLTTTLCRHLMRKPQDDTQHADWVHLLTNALAVGLGEVDQALVWRMTRSPYMHARQVAAVIFDKHIDAVSLSVREWVLLAHSDHAALRRYGCDACQQHVDRVSADLDEAVRLPDTDWEDTRAVGFALFHSGSVCEALQPAHLVALCDSIRPEVRAFGQDLLTRRFEQEQGREFLLKLSEHPVADMQMTAANWLLRHAGDTADDLRRLQPYLTTVLMRVNQSRVAKTRIYHFLAERVGSDRACAEVVRDILAPISQTIARGDRDRCMAILYQVARQHSDLTTPVQVIAPPLRTGRTRGV